MNSFKFLFLLIVIFNFKDLLVFNFVLLVVILKLKFLMVLEKLLGFFFCGSGFIVMVLFFVEMVLLICVIKNCLNKFFLLEWILIGILSVRGLIFNLFIFCGYKIVVWRIM